MCDYIARFWCRWVRCMFIGLAGALVYTGAFSADLEIRSLPSSIGTVTHFEFPKGDAYLLVRSTGKRLLLPRSWRQSNVEQVFQLGPQTAVVVSHSDNRCASKLSLIVLTPSKVWGAYNLGNCDDVMAYQQSADGSELVAVRVEGGTPLAWTYSASEQAFRGPVSVSLPASLQSFIGDLVASNLQSPLVGRAAPVFAPPDLPAARTPQTKSPSFERPQVPPQPLKAPSTMPGFEPSRPSAPQAKFPLPDEPKPPETKSPDVQAEAVKPEPQPARKPDLKLQPQQAEKPAAGLASRNPDVAASPVKKASVPPPGMTRDDASQVANQVKKSVKPQPRVNLDLT